MDIEVRSLGLYEWLTLAAIVLGPIVGIWVTRSIDGANERRKRRWELFVTLRRTRGLELAADHVAAINMVPVLFGKDQGVMEAWGCLLDSLNDPYWNSTDEKVKRATVDRSFTRRMDLVNAVALAVKVKLPDKEEHRQGYVPIAWSNEMLETMEIRRLLKLVLKGQQSLHMIAGIWQLPPNDQSPSGDTDSENKQGISPDSDALPGEAQG
jgi:hypothetical protein